MSRRAGIAMFTAMVLVFAPSASAIVGGKPANPADWEFLVALRHQGEVFCGGSVIAPTVVLTAAHCANAKPRKKVIVARRSRLGTSDGEVIRVVATAVHPDYKKKQRHDLALLFLARPTTAPPIALPSPEQDRAAATIQAPLRVAGFGARDVWGTRYPRVLKQTMEWVRRPRKCKQTYDGLFSSKSMICSLGRRFRDNDFHSTVCSGDSGGPMVADTPTGPLLVGVASYAGFICGVGFLPTVYARVASGLRFIERFSGITPASGAPPPVQPPAIPPVGS